MHERVFNPAEAHKLEAPDRLQWLPPGEVIALLELSRGMRIADIGAGTGYFAIPMAREIGPAGKVFAIDFQMEMLHLLRAKLAQPGMPDNIELVHGSAARTTLDDSSCDLVFLANVWHELDDYAAVLREAARVLSESGQIAVLDWRPDVSRPPGPPLEHRIQAAAVVETVGAAGWTLTRCVNTGTYSYLVVARAPR